MATVLDGVPDATAFLWTMIDCTVVSDVKSHEVGWNKMYRLINESANRETNKEKTDWLLELGSGTLSWHVVGGCSEEKNVREELTLEYLQLRSGDIVRSQRWGNERKEIVERIKPINQLMAREEELLWKACIDIRLHSLLLCVYNSVMIWS